MVSLKLKKQTYKSLDSIRLPFQASPGYTMLYVLLSVIHAFIPTAVTALTTAYFVDTAVAILQKQYPFNNIYLPLILMLLTLGIFTTIGAIIQLVKSRINLSLERKLKQEVVEKNAALEFKHIENMDSWELISRVTRNPARSVMNGFSAFISLIKIIISVTSVLFLIVTKVWWAAITILAFSIPMFWLSIHAGKKTYEAGRESERFNRRTDYLGEVLTSRDAVDERTLFGYGDEVNKRWQEQYEAGFTLLFRVVFKKYLLSKGSSMILALIGLLIALTLIRPVITGHISAGMFIGLVSAVFAMIQQLGGEMSSALEDISKVGEYMNDLTKFASLSEASGSFDIPDSEPISFESLEFRNVRFKYPSSDHYILNGLSFTLAKGLHYAFVGKNGAGKTTIIKLLTGLYNDYEGEILLNGKELRDYPASSLKAMYSVVYQDFAKYYIKLKDNIILGDIAGNVTLDRVSESVQHAGLDKTIEELQNGVDTPLGKILEGGQDLSGGQWQRVAIARSLISRAPVKMLDEPTAALDPLSESRLYEEFGHMMRGKTTILISHRLGSTKLADEILVIDNGKIVERGKHGELLQQNGQYCEMFETQQRWYR